MTALSPAAAGQNAARLFSLPFQHRAWQGAPGEFLAAGAGTSLDFHDHRLYAPGDDPRLIDWRACARTGQYLMKIYRAEAAPAVDILVDISLSMRGTPQKWRRTQELAAFATAAARESTRSGIRCWTHDGETLSARDPAFWLQDTAENAVLPQSLIDPASQSSWPSWPVRRGVMRVLISDLLQPCDPLPLFHTLAPRPGLAVVLAPWDAAEAAPDWSGNLRFEDIETREFIEQRFFDRELRDYTVTYQRHFAAIRNAARKTGALFARVPSAGLLTTALAGEPLRSQTLCPKQY